MHGQELFTQSCQPLRNIQHAVKQAAGSLVKSCDMEVLTHRNMNKSVKYFILKMHLTLTNSIHKMSLYYNTRQQHNNTTALEDETEAVKCHLKQTWLRRSPQGRGEVCAAYSGTSTWCSALIHTGLSIQSQCCRPLCRRRRTQTII